MRFSQIDRILDLVPGKSLTAVKRLTGNEDYLRDHFPKLPIMPGVLMVEALFQSAAWLVRKTDDFACTLVTLKEANNIKFAGFVQPGQEMVITVELIKRDGAEAKFKAQGAIDGENTVSGRLVLNCESIGERHPAKAAIDPYTRRRLREQFEALKRP